VWNVNKQGKAKTLGEKRVHVPLNIKSRVPEKVRVSENQESSPLFAKFGSPLPGFMEVMNDPLTEIYESHHILNLLHIRFNIISAL
jgi:hypothetical protein